MAIGRILVQVKDEDRGFKELMKSLRALANGDTYVKAGVIGEKAQEKHVGTNLTVAELGMVHEYGGGRVPERSFVRRPYDANKERYLSGLKVLVRAVYDGKARLESVLDVVGSNMGHDMRKAIRDIVPDGLAHVVAHVGADDVEDALQSRLAVIHGPDEHLQPAEVPLLVRVVGPPDERALRNTTTAILVHHPELGDGQVGPDMLLLRLLPDDPGLHVRVAVGQRAERLHQLLEAAVLVLHLDQDATDGHGVRPPPCPAGSPTRWSSGKAHHRG